MAGEVTSAIPNTARRGLAPLWVGLLGPPAAWSVHLLLGYLLVSVACKSNWSLVVLDLLLHGLTLLLAAVVVGTSLLAWRAVPGAGGESDADGVRGRQAFMGQGALLLGGLFVLLIVAGDIPNFFVPPCP